MKERESKLLKNYENPPAKRTDRYSQDLKPVKMESNWCFGYSNDQEGACIQEQVHIDGWVRVRICNNRENNVGTDPLNTIQDFVLFKWIYEMDPSKGVVVMNANFPRQKESQLRFSPIEEENISLDFLISSCSYWFDHCPRIEIYSDDSGHLSKPLCDIENKRLQKILSRAQNFVSNHFTGVKNEMQEQSYYGCADKGKDFLAKNERCFGSMLQPLSALHRK